MYFSPKLHVNLELGANAASGTAGFTYEIEYVIEFRGSVVWVCFRFFYMYRSVRYYPVYLSGGGGTGGSTGGGPLVLDSV